ncbi:MAG TPA: hypothetical protein VEG36_11215 [Burkholderiales bacterium]|nr:hypothetical protein [Burkholderiales bacterium]
MKRSVRATIIACGLVALLASSLAEAQWVLLARRAVGRIEQMSQQSPQADGAGYDSATVMIEAPADKVYAAVLRGLANNTQGMKITSENAQQRLVEFTNGQQIAGIKVSALGDDLTHMLISSAHRGNQPDAAALVLDSVLRVCAEMKVECSRAQQ